MEWAAVEKKLKNKTFSFFISWTEIWEIDLIKDVILEELPSLNESELSRMMIECYREMEPPRPLSEYLKLLRHKLELSNKQMNKVKSQIPILMRSV